MSKLARAHQATTLLVILLGGVHIAMTPVFFDELAMRVMWYVAQGIMGIVIGFLNIAAMRNEWQDRVIRRLCHIANGLGLVFVCFYTVVDPTLPSYIGTLFFVLLFGSAAVVARRSPRRAQLQ